MKRAAFNLLTVLSLFSLPAGAGYAQPAEGPPKASSAKVLYAITLRPGPAWKPGRPFVEQKSFKEHFAYVKRLFSEGRIVAAGGLGSENGLILFHALDQAEADTLLAGDPTVKAGTFVGEARRFRPAFISDSALKAFKE